MSDRLPADLARLFAGRFAQGRAPALAVRAARGGQVQVDALYGSTGPGAGAPTVHTPFRIASCTKSFTAAGILVLRGSGLLDLDEDIRAYLPQLRLTGPVWEAAPAGSRISLRMLLSMSAGFPTDDPWADRLEAMSREGFDALLAAGVRPVHRPGTVFEYSNLGYALLGRVIDRTSGQDYQEFITDALLRPLGLNSTRFDPRGPVPVAVGYRRAPAGWEPQPLTGPGAFSAIGGLVSTVADLHGWTGWLAAGFDQDSRSGHDRSGHDRSGHDGSGHDAGTDTAAPLPRVARREMQQIHQVCPALPDDPPGLVRGYGFGIRVEEGPSTGQVFFHSGGYPGYSSHMRWHPASGSAVVGFENATYSGVGVPARRALDLLIGASPPAPAPVSPRPPAAPPAPSPPWPELASARAAVESFLLRRDAESERGLRSRFAANVELDMPWDERLDQLDRLQDTLGPLRPPGGKAAADPPAASAGRPGSGAVLRWSLPAARGRLGCEIHLSPAEPPLVSVLRFAAQLPVGTGSAGNERMDPAPRLIPRLPNRKREHPMAPHAGKKKLEDLTPSERKGLGIATAIQFLLAGAALVDIWRRPQAQVRGSRGWWSAACAVNFVGPLSWFVFGRKKG